MAMDCLEKCDCYTMELTVDCICESEYLYIGFSCLTDSSKCECSGFFALVVSLTLFSWFYFFECMKLAFSLSYFVLAFFLIPTCLTYMCTEDGREAYEFVTSDEPAAFSRFDFGFEFR